MTYTTRYASSHQSTHGFFMDEISLQAPIIDHYVVDLGAGAQRIGMYVATHTYIRTYIFVCINKHYISENIIYMQTFVFFY